MFFGEEISLNFHILSKGQWLKIPFLSIEIKVKVTVSYSWKSGLNPWVTKPDLWAFLTNRLVVDEVKPWVEVNCLPEFQNNLNIMPIPRIVCKDKLLAYILPLAACCILHPNLFTVLCFQLSSLTIFGCPMHCIAMQCDSLFFVLGWDFGFAGMEGLGLAVDNYF